LTEKLSIETQDKELRCKILFEVIYRELYEAWFEVEQTKDWKKALDELGHVAMPLFELFLTVRQLRKVEAGG